MISLIAHLEHKIRPGLLSLLPHQAAIHIYSLVRAPYLQLLSNFSSNIQIAEQPQTHQKTLFKNNLHFRNDLGNAAGFDKDGSLLSFNYGMGAGFAVVGTVLSEPHNGNRLSTTFQRTNPWIPLPRSRSAINSLGLPSKGIEKAVANIRSFKETVQPKDFPIGVSIMGHPLHKTEEEKNAGIKRCVKGALEVADFIEVNESCPNTEHDSDAQSMIQRVKTIIALRNNQDRYVPILIKLGDIGDPKFTLPLLSDLGIDGVVLVNTQKDYPRYKEQIDPSEQGLYKYYTAKYNGGVSGEAIKDFSLEQASLAADTIQELDLNLDLIHVGGISEQEDIQHSRGLNKSYSREIIPLREWYTGLLEQMGKERWENIYNSML